MIGFQTDNEDFRFAIESIKSHGLKNDAFKHTAITALTLLNDLRYNTGKIKRSSVLHVLQINLDELLAALERQATRINALEAGLARVDERTKK